MPRSLSTTALVAINSPETEQVFVHLLTFTGTGLVSPIRLCDNPSSRLSDDPLTYGLVSRSNTFYFSAIEITLPASAPDQAPRARLAIDNVDRTLMADLRTLTSPLSVLLEVVRADAPDTVEFSVPGFQLRDITYSPQRVEGALTLRDIARDPFPAARFTPGAFPGLF